MALLSSLDPLEVEIFLEGEVKTMLVEGYWSHPQNRLTKIPTRNKNLAPTPTLAPL